MSSIEPSEHELEYARQQIEEANRRLSSIYERVGETLAVVEFDDNDGLEGSSKMTLENFGENEDLESFIEESDFLTIEEVSEKYIETQVNDESVGSHIQNVVIDSQLCIELAAKAMFKLVGKDHPFSHGISLQDGQTMGFYSQIPDAYSRKKDVVRVVFLTQFWGEFYSLAKYGAPKLNVRPEMIFTQKDGSRAVDDARFCIEVAESLLSFVEGQH